MPPRSLRSFLLLFLSLLCAAGFRDAAGQGSRRVVSYVDPFIGTGGHGHTYPGASVPFGMIQPGPDAGKSGWDWCSGYHYSDSTLAGFAHTHLSGTGCGDLGDILFLPGTGSRILAKGYRASFSHKEERASPGYYAVRLLDSGIMVELSATCRAAIHRYTFPRTDSALVAITLGYGQDDITTSAECSLQGDSVLVGYRYSNGWAPNQRVYFAVRFSQPLRSITYFNEGTLLPPGAAARGKEVLAVLRFEVSAGGPLLLKTGISAVSSSGALENLDAEIRGWEFEEVRQQAADAWESLLGRIRVDGTERMKRIFYTAMYHAMLAPTIFGDRDGRYRGGDDSIHRSGDFENYSTFSLWDTFRAAHPLYTILDPVRVGHMVRAMLAFARESGFLPVWPLAANETNTMIGYHAVPVITDAILKGIGGFDVREALQAMKRSALRQHRGLEYYAPSVVNFPPAIVPARRALSTPGDVCNAYHQSLSGDSIAYHSALPTATHALIVRADGKSPPIEWKSVPVPTGSTQRPRSFIWLAGMAAGKGAHRFSLSVNGIPVAGFTTAPSSSRRDWSITGKNGVTLSFRTSSVDWFGDLFGTMVVTLPPDLVKAGEAQTFRISAEESGSPDWFMTFTHSFTPGMLLANEFGTVLEQGRSSQVVRVDIQHLGTSFDASLQAEGASAVPVVVHPGLTSVWLRVPAVTNERRLRVRLHSKTQMLRVDSITVTPVHPVGYIPADKEPESVSKTLEYAFDDWCIAQVAHRLGESGDDSLFTARSGYFRNVFDRSTGFMRGRNLDGRWRTPFDPRFSTQKQPEYTEGNAWQYSWFVPHDIDGLIALMGGQEAFTVKLDSLFSQSSSLEGTGAPADVSGLIGMYAHGNEPSHHIAYLYACAGKPWKTQELVRRIMRTMYDVTPDGLSGNEDCGQMSAWYVLSALGFYPVNPAGGVYVIGSPLVESARLDVGGGRSFIIRATNMSDTNVYIQSMTLNGTSLDRLYLRHEEIMAGGILEFLMGPAPKTGR